ncbi:MAG: cobamide remodeling phosphodiesterase CbiR [Anaerolineae bacterium]|nr:TIM barrel protein [Anaerolineae bacterium]MDW8099660.1 cobamide remodeling phosphodiesterase CbiR [Anaerolineae bacterium]
MRIGSTSYVYPADILPNVERLAGLVDDIELVLFEVDEYGSNLPDATTVDRLNELAAIHGLTYTVHLPLDLRLADDGSAVHVSLEKAHKVIDRTSRLLPWGYIVHLNGDVLQDQPTPDQVKRWQERAQRSLEIVCTWLDDPRRLCLENVERWDPTAFAPIVQALPISRCVDVGHLWMQGADPLEHLGAWMERTRVVHIHGLAERDHQSLAHMPPERLDPMVAFLVQGFRGVVTLEVFGEADFFSSLAAWRAAVERVSRRWVKP